MLRTYSNENNIQNLSEIEQLRAEGTHNEANEGTYLDQLNNNTIQMISCTIKKNKKNIYIYIPTNKNGNHEPISFYMAGTLWDGMISYLYYFPVNEQHFGSIFAFLVVLPIVTMITYISKGRRR